MKKTLDKFEKNIIKNDIRKITGGHDPSGNTTHSCEGTTETITIGMAYANRPDQSQDGDWYADACGDE